LEDPVAGRRQRAAFRPAATAVRAGGPNRRQSVVLLLALTLVAGAITVASFAVRPAKARAFELFYGSVFIDDNTAPVAVDLATGKPSVRLTNAYTQVSAKASGDLDVIPLQDGTLLLDSATGEFNMLDSTGFVLKASGGGVSLPNAADTTHATGLAAGASAYIVRTSSSGTSVYLVGQSTVSAAAGGARTQARASVTMPQPAGNDVATTAVTANSSTDPTANSDLWLLVGAGTTRTIRQLRVPAKSNAGATLSIHDHGTVSGVAAMAASTRNADGTGGDVVAVASQGAIDVFDGASQLGRIDVPAPTGVDAILPASNQQGRFAFLYHSASGWSLVRTSTDARGPATVNLLPQLTGTDLAPPAQSRGALYTIDRSSGALWRISRAGRAVPVSDVSEYPRVAGETASFGQATVLARGTRVIFNSRANLEALTVFADGSHRPVVIDKRTAVDVSSNGAAALANLQNAHATGSTAPTAAPTNKPKPNPAEPVTDKIDCSNTTQIPHIPSVQLVSKGSRSIQLQWTYPLLDRQDCAPSTYTVSLEAVGNQAPAPPGPVTVQGVTGVNLTGLFPDTQYKVVVNAYINGTHTPSAPLLVRTQVEGPAAPTGLQVSADDSGNWHLSWNSCGGVQQGCVPVTSWTVIPQLCQSTGGLIGTPPDGRLIADPTTHSFTYTYAGGDALLGYGLNFAVEGVGDSGTIGEAATSSGCVHSWAHPIADNIHVAASTPPHTAQGGSSSTTVNVTFTGDQDVALGGIGGQLTYRLLSGGTLVQQRGPTGDTTASLAGVQPGQPYQVQVIVAPPGHPTASVALPPVDVQAAIADWPALSVSASFAPNPPASGALIVAISGLTSADARGETFDLVDSQLVCGNTALPLNQNDFDPARPLTFGHIDRAQYNGGCTVQIALQENAGTVRSPAYFGGTASRAATSPGLSIPVPALDTSASQFSANFSGGDVNPQIVVSYTGGNGLLASYGTSWSLQPTVNGTACGGSTGNPAAAPVAINLGTCYFANYNGTWQVQISFSYFGQSPATPYTIAVNGTGPQPIDASKINFTGTWSSGSIAISYSGPYPDSTLATVTWSESVTSDQAPGTCASASQTPSNTTPITLTVDATACPPTATSTPAAPPPATGTAAPSAPAPPTGSAGAPVVTPTTYTVQISFSDPNYPANTGSWTVKVPSS
jgi:hypothetical protein